MMPTVLSITSVNPTIEALTALLVSVFAFIKWLLPWIRSQNMKNRVINSIRAMQSIYQCIDNIIKNTRATRVVIFSGHNGGGVPKPGSPYFVSAVYWKLEGKNEGQVVDISDYRNVPVDGNYVDVLLETINKDVVRIETEKLPDSQLKTYYLSEGVKFALVYFLGVVDNNLIYASVATTYDEDFSQLEATMVGLKVNAIKSSLQMKTTS